MPRTTLLCSKDEYNGSTLLPDPLLLACGALARAIAEQELLSFKMLLITIVLSFAAAATAQRQFEVIKNCQETLWPALTNQGIEFLRTYSGIRGWKAPPGHHQLLTLPETWNGRIWPRRMCNFDSAGAGSCVTGNCAGGLNCKDNEGDFFSLGEFNLNSWGSLDFYDLSFVAGFNVPMSIEPDGCQALACTTDINVICPDERMKQKDASGRVVGCRSACFAGINAQVPSINCCSGIYESIPACVPDRVDYYGLFKPICPNAYWYPRDQRDGNPQVDWACSATKKPKYTITFCPEEGAKVGSKKLEVGYPSQSTGTATHEATGTATATGTSAGGELTASGTSTSTSTSSESGAASTATQSGTSTGNDKILGLSKPVFIAICAVAALVVIGVIVCFACRRSRSSTPPPTAAPLAANELGESDSEEDEKRYRRHRSYDSPLLR
ncbi:hypothetical protein JCM10908_002173 [Rhodotorula pacifica]|uniref:thaumatin family protein n=1 Tax=Rhodotorula pacifica TaxID=1495444 RepID=UPI0031744EA3